jgi:hypothetical protein
VDFRDSPVAPLDDAVTKAEAIKSTFEEAATAAKAPGPAFEASAQTGLDPAVADL